MVQKVRWAFKKFEVLNIHELYELLQLRTAVFVLDQRCVYQDMDGMDDKAIHLFGYWDNKLVACCRIFPPDVIAAKKCNFGRVAVLSECRGKGIGRDMMLITIQYLKEHWARHDTVIHAQLYLKSFYVSLGFEAFGEVYDDVGIPHINMILRH